MNTKRFVLASIAVFIVYEVVNFLTHSVLLSKTYQTLAQIWRPDMMDKMPVMYISTLIFSFMFVYIFTKGLENKGVSEGIRFGLVIGLLMIIPGMLNQYVVYPVPFNLVIKWILTGLIQYILCGITASLVYKTE